MFQLSCSQKGEIEIVFWLAQIIVVSEICVHPSPIPNEGRGHRVVKKEKKIVGDKKYKKAVDSPSPLLALTSSF